MVGLGVRTIKAAHSLYVGQLKRADRLQSELEDARKTTWSGTLTPVSRKTFTNEQIEVDGKSFDHCTFTNPTFTFHGNGPWQFMECQFHGVVITRTDNRAAMGFLELFTAMRNMPGVSKTLLGEQNESGAFTIKADFTPPVKPDGGAPSPPTQT